MPIWYFFYLNLLLELAPTLAFFAFEEFTNPVAQEREDQ